MNDEVLGDLDEVVHTEDTVDSRPVPRETTPIEVPARAKAQHLGGRLVLSLLIGADGRVRQARVLEADPPGVFEDAALVAVRGWVFEPATYQGRPVEVWATLPVEFAP
ncbi:MAG: energy transducer TonB [Planctomycetota bacterium]